MLRTEDVKRNWHLTDAQGKILGRFATQVAWKLMGKHKNDYTPHTDAGDYVVIINASKIAVSGTKVTGKTYYSFSGYPSGLSKASFEEVLKRTPDRILREAIKRMLPDNKLRDVRMSRLKIYAGADHKHESQLSQAE